MGGETPFGSDSYISVTESSTIHIDESIHVGKRSTMRAINKGSIYIDKECCFGEEVIVGAAAVVNGYIPFNSSCGGNKARVFRNNIEWER